MAENENNEAEAAETPTEVAEEAAPVEAAADEPPAEEAAPAEAQAAEPVTPLTPKERKVASRERRGQRRLSTPEERAEERKRKAASRRRWRANAKKRRPTGDGEGTPKPEPAETNPQTRLGTVVSTKADKTITVRIDIARRHKRYQKIVRSSWKLHAHDERNEANEGDVVRVVECRPLSRTKRWRLTDVLERAK